MVEEILRSLSENPELVAIGAGAAYAGLTYLSGRMETPTTRIEAKEAKEDSYSSPFDYLKGLHDRGKKDAAQEILEEYRGDYLETEIEDNYEDMESGRNSVGGD